MSANQQLVVTIGDRFVGVGQPVFVIAEAGVNHNGDLSLAKQLVDLAAEAGADAVKFQTFKAEAVVTKEAPKADYQLRTTGAQESQFDMLRRLELSQEAHLQLQKYCHERGLIFLSTPFDEAAADFLNSIDVPAFKISSGDLTNIPLLEHVAGFGKAVILSTGMSDMEEVAEAVDAIQTTSECGLVLLHCVTNYPADPREINLRAMNSMQERFDLPVGFSDHTEGIEVSLAAVALGASVIEKHFTLSRSLPGPDHQASMEPDELRALVRGIRKVELSLGSNLKQPSASELETAKVARRSLIAAVNIEAGTVLTRELIALKRPGTGLAPSQLKKILGKKTLKDISEGSLISLDMLG